MRSEECKVQSAERQGRGSGGKRKSDPPSLGYGATGTLGPKHLTPPSPSEPDRRSSGEGITTGDGRILVTRRGLAVALGVSLRTVERMLHDGEIEPVRLRGWSVRFYVPDVLCALSASALTRKNGRKARVVEG